MKILIDAKIICFYTFLVFSKRETENRKKEKRKQVTQALSCLSYLLSLFLLNNYKYLL